MDQRFFPRLLRFSQQLQAVVSYTELIEFLRDEIAEVTGYQHAWIYVLDAEHRNANCVAMSAELDAKFADVARDIPVAGDKLLAQLLAGEGPVVVLDAWTDSRTNKVLVNTFRNRTIINIPMVLVEGPLGIFGTGTFGGPEEVRAPTAEQLDYLTAISGIVALAVARVRLLKERETASRAREAIYQRMLSGQRMETLGLIAGGIAYDFNNLLHVASMNLGIIQESTDPQMRQTAVDAIRSAVKTGADLTKRLLAFGRRRPYQLQAWDVNEVADETCRLLKPLLGAGIKLVFALEPNLGSIYVDRTQLEEVLTNLVLNGRDALPQGGTLTISTATVGHFIRITVTDTGAGLSPEIRCRVFEPYFIPQEKEHGIGLGLATVNSILKEYGVTLDIESESNRGTKIGFSFPRYGVALTPNVAASNLTPKRDVAVT